MGIRMTTVYTEKEMNEFERVCGRKLYIAEVLDGQLWTKCIREMRRKKRALAKKPK
jgi:hypothetical protein